MVHKSQAWTVSPIFQSFDRLFGLQGVYEFTHLFLMRSILIFQDRFCPPEQDPETGDPREGPRCHHGTEGWQEGLRQKGWTIITIMLINLVAERCNTSATLIGQGTIKSFSSGYLLWPIFILAIWLQRLTWTGLSKSWWMKQLVVVYPLKGRRHGGHRSSSNIPVNITMRVHKLVLLW